MPLFIVGERTSHDVANLRCPGCVEGYPEPCRCGGLMHAGSGGDPDADGNMVVITRCDRCGRDEDDLDRV